MKYEFEIDEKKWLLPKFIDDMGGIDEFLMMIEDLFCSLYDYNNEIIYNFKYGDALKEKINNMDMLETMKNIKHAKDEVWGLASRISCMLPDKLGMCEISDNEYSVGDYDIAHTLKWYLRYIVLLEQRMNVLHNEELNKK